MEAQDHSVFLGTVARCDEGHREPELFTTSGIEALSSWTVPALIGSVGHARTFSEIVADVQMGHLSLGCWGQHMFQPTL